MTLLLSFYRVSIEMTQETSVQQKASARPNITIEDYNSGEYKWYKNKCKVLLFQFNTSKDESKGIHERKPQDREIENLKECFHCLLGSVEMDFVHYTNQDVSQLADTVDKEIQDDEKNKGYDCFIFIFLTFGKDDKIFCYDGEIAIANILDPIKKKQSMALRPKIIIIQSDDERLEKIGVISKDGGGKPVVKKVPQEADFFIMHSIIPECHFPVKPDVENECIFVTALRETVQEAKKAKKTLDIHRLSLGINAKVDARLKTGCLDKLPIPEVTSTLTRALYFPCGS